jgi:cytochrome c2
MPDAQEQEISGLRAAILVVGFILLLPGVFVYLGAHVTDLQGGAVASVSTGVSPERGETIFWGKGICYSCHSIGDRGNMKRCPNIGESRIGPPIGERAKERAVKRAAETEKAYTSTDYLVECIADPSAYLVDGYPDKLMPLVYAGQVDLDLEEVMSVIAYLQTLGGELDLEAIAQSMSRFGQVILQKDQFAGTAPLVVSIDLPYPVWEVLEPEQLAEYHAIRGAEARAAYVEEFLDEEQREIHGEILEEWIEDGRIVFADNKCWQCHAIEGQDFGEPEPGNLGPDLTGIGTMQTREYILESILNPNAVIVPPIEDHSQQGRSKMPSYAEQIGVRDLLTLATFLSAQTTVPLEPESGPSTQVLE